MTRNGVPLPSEITTLAEVFREAGYATAAFVSSVVLAPRFGWEQGFEHYDAAFPKSRETVRDRSEFWKDQDIEGFDRRAADTNALAIPWLRQAAEPFFLFVHSFDPHAPYEGAPEYLNYVPIAFSQKTATAHVAVEGTEEQQTALRSFRRAVSKAVRHYHAEVLQTDTEVGHLLAVLGALKIRSRTLVVLTSDHGEGLGQHGLLDHAAHLYGEQLRVPLIVSGAGVAKPGLRIPTPVGLVDPAPTLATLAGLSFPEPTDGRSLATTIQAGTELRPRPLLGRRRHYSRRFGKHSGTQFFVRSVRWKYIRSTDHADELYDLEGDVDELRNVHDLHDDVVARLSGILGAHVRKYPPREDSPALSPQDRRALEALGYVSD